MLIARFRSGYKIEMQMVGIVAWLCFVFPTVLGAVVFE